MAAAINPQHLLAQKKEWGKINELSCFAKNMAAEAGTQIPGQCTAH